MDAGPTGFVVFLLEEFYSPVYDGNMDMEAERGEIKMKKEMKIEINCPVCDAFIEIEDDAGYCIICDEVIYKEPDGTFTSDSLEWLNENPTPKKKKKCRK